ncbi:MAG TPA: glycosyltransferase family 2 protein, partial [Clostridiaceae bacterium]|nr:glycosyltransferase family 2 protein [Clostridiaceae bacterium]
KVSVIIPARNEENSLPLLLDDLSRQTYPAHEILCIDDDSTDRTGEVALSHGAKVVSLREKPEGWNGKSWACQKGADSADGDLLLFLDADVRLGEDSVERIIRAYIDHGCVISVQPYHDVPKTYEQFSMFFNLVQVAANGMGLPGKDKGFILYGPVILISHSDYGKVGGHASIRERIVDDMALGERLRNTRILFRLYLGDRKLSYRMYGGGFRDLYEGWMKNMAAGALKTPPILFILVFLWITSSASVPLHLILAAVRMDMVGMAFYLFLYLVWVGELYRISGRIGSFEKWGILFYPVLLAFYIVVFFLSMVKRVFRIKVAWKGREVKER